MRAGSLTKLVTVEQKSSVRDSFGQPLNSWVTFKQCYAAIGPVSGREFISQSAEVAQVTHKIEMRYFAGLLPTHRIKFGARVFEIKFIANVDERNEKYIVQCTELVA